METQLKSQGRAGPCSHNRQNHPRGLHSGQFLTCVGPGRRAHGSLPHTGLKTAELKIGLETIYALPFYSDKYTSQLPGRPGLSLGPLDSLGSALEHGDGAGNGAGKEVRADLLPSFSSCPSSVPQLGGFGCTYVDPPAHMSKLRSHSPSLGPGGAVRTREDEARRWPLQAQGPRYPEFGTEAHTHRGRLR